MFAQKIYIAIKEHQATQMLWKCQFVEEIVKFVNLSHVLLITSNMTIILPISTLLLNFWEIKR